VSQADSLPPLAPLGFGCAQLFRLHSARDRRAVLAAGYDAGIRHFDVAPLYGLGQAETELGQFLRGRRDTATVTTKFGLDPAAGMSAVRVVQGVARRLVGAVPPIKRYLQSRRRLLAGNQSFEPSIAQRSLERSLRRLNTDYIDYFLLHEPTADLVDRDRPMEFLQRQKERGLIRAFGIAGPVQPLAAVIARHPTLASVVQHPGPQLGEQHAAFSQRSYGQSFIYGSVGPRLQAIKTMLAANPKAGEEFQARFGHNWNRRLARLLLLEQRTGEPDCLALFGSTSVPHVMEMVSPPSVHERDLVTRLRLWATVINARRT
jgi:D-threo-aldose 1-dehydrogenase